MSIEADPHQTASFSASTLIKKRTACAVIACAMIVLAGCGKASPPTGTVRGSVMTRGERLPGGRVCVISKAGAGAVAAVAADGTYSFEDRLPVGQYTVWLMLPAPSPPGEATPSPGIDEAKWGRLVPAEYRTQTSSPLRFVLKPGANEFLIEITDPLPKS